MAVRKHAVGRLHPDAMCPAYLTSSGGKYQVLLGVFSEHLYFTGNSVSSEHPPCCHSFGLAHPTTDKQIKECTRRPRFGGLLNIYLFLSVSFTVIPILPCQDISSVAAFYKHRKWKKCKICKQQFVYHSLTTNMAYHLKTVS